MPGKAKIPGDVIKAIGGVEDVVDCVKKVRLATNLQEIGDWASFMPLYL